MTWGQLRLQLQTSAPGVSLDLLDEFLNTRYEAVLEATDWTGLKANTLIQTQAAYQSSTDSVTLTVGSNAVTGASTTWTSAITGQRFYRPGDTVIYTATYVSATSLTLDRVYEGNGTDATGTVYSASAYVFMQHIYSLPSDCRSIVEVINPITNRPMKPFSEAGLDASAGPRTLVQDPLAWAEYADSVETSPPVLHQIEFYPPPLRSRGIPLEYLRAALGFDGGNTSGTPLPFVTSAVLLHGCRADSQLYLAGQAAEAGNPGASAAHANLARGHEALFEVELGRLLRVEHQQRRVKTPVQMAARFVRHRMARATRTYGRGWGVGRGGPS